MVKSVTLKVNSAQDSTTLEGVMQLIKDHNAEAIIREWNITETGFGELEMTLNLTLIKQVEESADDAYNRAMTSL